MASKDSNKLIKKANELVESRYKFDIWETRVFAKMITLINKDDEDFKTYRIYIKEIQDDFQLSKNKDAYKRLKDGARRLMRRIVKITYNTDEGEKVLETPVIIGLETLVAGKSFIDVSFHPNMKPFLLQLKSQFLMYDIRNILKISSVHSVRIYELLKQYEKIGFRTFLVEELKDILQVSEKYPLYANFKQRIIKKAQKDLEKYTDISFTYEEIKKVRSVEKIKFFIHKNIDKESSSTKQETSLAEVSSVIDEEDDWKNKLREEGIKDDKVLDALFKAHALKHIQATFEKCQKHFNKNKGSVNNKAGYLLNAINKGYYNSEIVEDDRKIEQEKKRKERERLRLERENQYNTIKTGFYKAYTVKLGELKVKYLDESLLEKILDEKKSTPFYQMVQTSIQNNENSKMLDAWVNDFLAEKYLTEEEANFDLYLKKYHPDLMR
ncbi:replication initiation protein [Aureispira sp. CCB-QB1]|uniref:replication initiation protein n=1 Tax=Aureispira sp. CCB-QB1 TaxID=1313421 RepID=UPI000696749B|nr:replication initiation protein [Aureispira sp. CCB-QB1]